MKTIRLGVVVLGIVLMACVSGTAWADIIIDDFDDGLFDVTVAAGGSISGTDAGASILWGFRDGTVVMIGGSRDVNISNTLIPGGFNYSAAGNAARYAPLQYDANGTGLASLDLTSGIDIEIKFLYADLGVDVPVNLFDDLGVNEFNPIITQAASRHEVDPALVKAIIMAESGYNPRAVSKKGAMGLMQLMPGTAKDLGVVDSFNPEYNINAGVKYFKQLLKQFKGDVSLALAAYNAGSRKVKKYQGIPPIKATHYYIEKVFEYYQDYKKEMARGTDKAQELGSYKRL